MKHVPVSCEEFERGNYIFWAICPPVNNLHG